MAKKKRAIGTNARAALGTAATLTLMAVAIGDGTLGLLVGVINFVLISYAMTLIPLRYSMLGLTFFALVLPNPGEGQPTKWAPPFSVIGQALLNHMNTIERSGLLGILPISAMELFFVVLFLIHQHRKRTKSKIDGDVIPTPKPLIQLAYLALLVSGFTWIMGLALGGNFGMSLWQLNAVIYLPLVFLLLQAGFRGPSDHWALARVYLAAAFYKCLLALYVVNTQVVPLDPETGSTRPPYGTAHADSMLFSISFVIVIASLLERIDRQTKRLAFVMLPILLAGTIANNRRLAWVQIAIVMLMVYLVSRETRVKKFVRRAVLVSVPLAMGYVAAGWNVEYSRFFKPVRMIRSVVDADSDGSSRWREFENVNIIVTFRENPLLGTGYGHPYREVIVLPQVEYPLEPYIPHNSLLGLWGYAGGVGFAGLTLLWIAGVYFAMRAYRSATEPSQRIAAIVSFGAVPIYLTQCWGDLGLAAWTGVFMMAASLTVAGKLAVATGQWQTKKR